MLVPTQEAVQKLVAARLAADVMEVPTVLIARTDAEAADLITSDCDEYDREFVTGERTPEGFFRTRAGVEQAISRGLAYAPYADVLWCETSTPDLALAKRFADAIHERFPGKLLAYNCSPSFNWKKNLDDRTIAHFQQSLSEMGYRFQFITLAGIHSMWFNMFDLARLMRRVRACVTTWRKCSSRNLRPGIGATPSHRISRKWVPAILTASPLSFRGAFRR